MLKKISLVSVGIALIAPQAFATSLFSDAGEALTNYSIVSGGDSSAQVVDYSNFTFGSVTHNIIEAPTMIGGSASTTGILLAANETLGVATGINLILGNSPITFNQPQYTMSFDMYMKFSPSGVATTEEVLWGVGRTTTPAFGRWNSASGNGTWGYATNEGGSSVDYAVNVNGVRTQTLNNSAAIPQSAFTSPPYNIAGTPGGAWSRVTIEVDNGAVRVKHNNVTFFTELTGPTSGFAFIGYDDPFSSLSADPGNQWTIIDNVRVDSVPEPASMVLLGLAGLAALKRRKKS